jgi:hypothetical protein
MHEKFCCFLLLHPDFSWFPSISLVICSSVIGFKISNVMLVSLFGTVHHCICIYTHTDVQMKTLQLAGKYSF